MSQLDTSLTLSMQLVSAVLGMLTHSYRTYIWRYKTPNVKNTVRRAFHESYCHSYSTFKDANLIRL
jgi:hypothetical protein